MRSCRSMENRVKRNTKRVGDISEIMVLGALIRADYYVSVPFGENQRYDLIAEKDNVLYRVQVKSGRLRKGAILFACYSSHGHRGGGLRRYDGEVDLFGVYCPDVDSIYLIPMAEISAGALVIKRRAAKKWAVKESPLGLSIPAGVR